MPTGRRGSSSRPRRPKLKTCWRRFVKVESFDEIAKKNSDGPTAAQGGDLGYFKRGTLAKELEDKTFAMKPGDVSDVIRTKQGFVILRVVEHQIAGVPPLSEIEPRVQDAIYMSKLQPALRAYLTEAARRRLLSTSRRLCGHRRQPNQTAPVETTAKECRRQGTQEKEEKAWHHLVELTSLAAI